MGYELIHDHLARQIYAKASTEAQTRRKIEKFVWEHYRAHRERGARLNREDLDYITPYLSQVNISAEEAAFLEKAKQGIRRARRRIQALVTGVILLLLTLLGLAIWQWSNAATQSEEALRQRSFALEKSREAEEKAAALVKKEAALQLSLQEARMAKDTAEVRRQEAELARLRARRQAFLAEQARRAALDSAQVAAAQRQLARAAEQLARAAEQLAIKNAEVAQRERNIAERKTIQSKAMRVALAARYARYKGQNSLAFRLAEEVLLLQKDSIAHGIAAEVLKEIGDIPLVRDFVHQDQITHLQFSARSDRLLTTSLDHTAKWWAVDGTLLQTFPHDSGVIAACLAPQDAFLVTATENHQILLWDLQGQQLARFNHRGAIQRIVLSADGRWLLSAAADSTARLWDLAKQTMVQQFAHDDVVTDAAFFYGNDQPEIITTSLDRTAKRWSLTGQSLLQYPNPLQAPLRGVAVSPDQREVLLHTGAEDFMLAADGQELREVTAVYFHRFQPNSARFSLGTHPKRVISLAPDSSKAYVWNFTDPDRDLDMQYTPKQKVRFMTLAPSAELVLLANGAHEMILFQLKKDLLDANVSRYRFNASVNMGCFSPDNKLFLSTDGGMAAQLWRFTATSEPQKRRYSPQEITQLYQQRIRPLSQAERKLYQLD